MTAEQLDAIIADAAPTFEYRARELYEHILDAAREALAASQEKDDGGKPKVTVSLKLVIGLNSSPPWWQTTAAVGVTFRSEGEPVNLSDTNQPELGLV
jgi:hypothetical protein